MSKTNLKLLVDWNNDGDFVDTGDDVTSRTLQVQCTRGRDTASSLTGRTIAGLLRATLNNESGDYSSEKAGSPLSGNVVPRRKVRLRTDSFYWRTRALGPIGHWRLGEATGTVATDEEADNNGTYVGSPTLGVTGALSGKGDEDTAVTFDASDDEVNIGNIAAFQFTKTTAFSIAFWFKTAGTGTMYMVAKKAAAAGYAVLFSATKVQFLLEGESGSTMSQTTDAAFHDDAYHYCVITYDGSNTKGGMLIYIDGSAVAITSAGDNGILGGQDITNSISLKIGRRDGSLLFDGELDEVAVYSKALTSANVTSLNTAGTEHRIEATIWTGYLSRILPEVNKPRGPNLVVLEAIGALGVASSREVRIPMRTSRRTDQAIQDILEDLGWTTADFNLETGQTTMTRWWADGRGLQALRVVELTEAGLLREERTGEIFFEDRHFRLTDAESRISQATFSDASSPSLPYVHIKQEDPLPNIFNDFRAEVQRFTVGGLAVLWTLAASGANSPSIGGGESKTFWARYPVKDSPTEDIAVDAWTTPAATTDYTANTAADGSGSNVTGDVAVAVNKYATEMEITLTNNGTVSASITLLQARGTPVKQTDPVTIVAEDATSQTNFEKRTWPSRTPFIPDEAEAQDWADYHLAIYKDPIKLLKLSYTPNRDTTAQEALRDLDISQRVTIVAQNTAGLGINADYIIEGIDYRFEQDQVEGVGLLLSPADSYTGFWVLGVSTLGETTTLAY